VQWCCVCEEAWEDQEKKGPFRILFSFLFWGVDKSQGRTFQKVAIYLPSPVFAHGQLYVALLRVGGVSSLCWLDVGSL